MAVAGHQPLEIGLNRVDLHDRLQDEIRTSLLRKQVTIGILI
jgi:hypothetical protein